MNSDCDCDLRLVAQLLVIGVKKCATFRLTSEVRTVFKLLAAECAQIDHFFFDIFCHIYVDSEMTHTGTMIMEIDDYGMNG
jgi:hypothetical protein